MPDVRVRFGAQPSSMLRALCLILTALAFVSPLHVGAQDLGAFLSPPPPPGGWARYRIETRDPGAPEGTPPKVKILTLATIAPDPEVPKGTVWVEASPMNLAGDKDGTMRLLLDVSPTEETNADPLLRAKAVQFLPSSGPAYILSDSALRFFQRQLSDVKVVREQEELPSEPVTDAGGSTFDCFCRRVKTHAEGEVLFKHRTLLEEGTLWFSAQTPFRLVQAKLIRTETREGKPARVREVTILLESASPTGSRTAFSSPPSRTRGLLSLLLR